MHLTNLKQARYYIPLGLVVILAVTSAVIFHPAFQKKMLLEHVGPLVDSLEIGSVHLTPWSLELDNIGVGYQGGRFQLEHGSIRFCLSSLLLRDLDIKSLALMDIRVDLREFSPPEGPTEKPGAPFPGVLASLVHGFSYSLLHADIDAEVLLPGKRTLTARITGSGIRPQATGALYLQARFNTGEGDDNFDLDSRIYLAQLTRGRFRLLDSYHTVQAALASLPETERAEISLNVKSQAVADAAGSVNTGGENEPVHQPEHLQLSIHQKDSSGEARSVVELQGEYNGNTGVFGGDYRVTANQRLVQPYAGDTPIPNAEQTLTGALDFNLADLTGDMTITSDLLVSNLRKTADNAQLPELLRLENNLRVALLPDRQLLVETLDSGMSDEIKNRPLTTRLPGDLQVPLEDISGFLHQENTLLEFELPVVPLRWFDFLLPDRDITAGTLSGAFTITTDAQSAIHLKPLRPLRIDGLTIEQQDGALVKDMNLTALPSASYRGNTLQVSVDKLEIATGKDNLTRGGITFTLPLADTGSRAFNARIDADLDTYNLATLLTGRQTRKPSLPRHLSLEVETQLRQQTGRLTFEQLDTRLATPRGTRLLDLQLQQPVIIDGAATGMVLHNSKGTLATLAVSDIQLGWFSAFVPDITLHGKLHRANFVLTADAPGVAGLTASNPLRLAAVTISGRDGPMLDALGVSVLPALRRTADGTAIHYRDLIVTGGSNRLVTGNGQVTLPGDASAPLLAEGHLEADLQGLSRQPVLANALQAALSAPLRMEADYRLAQDANRIDISRLKAGLFYSEAELRVALQADSGIRIPTRLNHRSALGGTRGKITFAINNLTPEPFADILAANGVMFDSINIRATLDTNGRAVTVKTLEPLVVAGLSARSDDDILLRPFTLTADADAVMQGDHLHARLDEFSARFANERDTQTLQGRADLALTGSGGSTRAELLDAELTLQLPGLLDQPALLPGNTLAGGELKATLRLDPQGKLTASARVQDLRGERELPLRTLFWRIDGQLDPDGSYAIKAPVTTEGKSGNSSIRIVAKHTVKTGANDDVAITIDSPVLYLNDILNTLYMVAGRQASAEEEKSDTAEQAVTTDTASDTAADTRAFWDQTDYDAHIAFSMGRLFYTDYLEITDIRGHAGLLPERLAFNDFEAHFHDSPITADGTLDFSPGEMPYNLKMRAAVEQFDIARFLRELAPGSKPRAEGLFNVSIDAFGRSPNMAQYRNNLFFDARLQSKNGLFRLLDPDSPLVTGSTSLAGGVGEVVSYIPTGLFGLGEVSRLVNYIKKVKYDKIDIHLVRDASRDVQIREYVVQSPELLLTASGGIEYQEGKDVLQSPLTLDAQLNMRGKGAAIFYDLDLLQSERDDWGYWKGPAIRYWGTPANMESNLGDFISEAGQGVILGGVTRPISGLIGNIKYRWFGDDKSPLEYTGKEE